MPIDGQQFVDSTPKQDSTSGVLVSVEQVSKRYKVGKQTIQAVTDGSLDIYEGEFVAIIGPSGSGKSTLLQILGGLDKPSSGTVTVDGRRLDKMTDRKLSMFRNQMIGFVFQSFYLQPFLSLRRNIEIAGMPNRMKKTERNQHIERIAAAVGLQERLSHRPKELSGGQIQRAAIARALLNQPRIILADEPTGNLDSQNSLEIISIFRNLQQKFGTTIIIVTHDHEMAAQADRVISMKDGVIT